MYLQRGVRTVQRWEKELGLPVRRLGGGRGEVVFALTDDLDRWLLSREGVHARGEDLVEPADSTTVEDVASRPETRAPGDGDRADGHPAGAGAEWAGSTPVAERPGPGHPPRPALQTWRRATMIAALLLAAGTLTGAGWLARDFLPTRRNRNPPAAGRSDGLSDANPVKLRVEHDAIVVFNVLGQEVWRHRFEEHCDPAAYEDVVGYRSLFRVEDIDGDGSNEVLFIAGYGGFGSDSVDALYVFNGDGTLRFRYAPRHRVRFGVKGHPRGGPYSGEPPWFLLEVYLDGTPGGPRRIWLASSMRFYPSGLDRIEPDGRVTATYWSNGFVTGVAFARLNGRDVVLVGASNNEHMGGSLAVLDAAAPAATAPAADPGYRCVEGCNDAVPLRFLVWPQPPLLAGVEATDPISQITVSDAGRVSVLAASPSGLSSPDGNTHFPHRHYILGPNLEIEGAELDASYTTAYQVLLRAGVLHRPYDPRPEAHLFPVLEWDGHAFRRITGLTSRQ